MFYKSGAIINSILKERIIVAFSEITPHKIPAFLFDRRKILRRCVGVTVRFISSVLCDETIFLMGHLYVQLL
jgi:hypothetical protein